MSLSYNYLEYLVKIKATVRVKETKNSQDLVAKSYLLLTSIGKADTMVKRATGGTVGHFFRQRCLGEETERERHAA